VRCITLEFSTVVDPSTQDLYTHIASLELELQHGISVAQTSEHTLEFESERDRSFAMLVLGKFPQFIARLVD
jgi:hypothetical protein